jgi:hypothetical protein
MTKTRNPKRGNNPERSGSMSQPDGTAADRPRGEAQAPPGNADRETDANARTQEGQSRQINPSAPTQGTESGHVTQELVSQGPSTRDAFGEVGHSSGKGTLEIDEQTISTGSNPNRKPEPERAADPADEKDESAA